MAQALGDALLKLSEEAELLNQQEVETQKLVGEKAAALVNHINSGPGLGVEARKETIHNLIGSGETPAHE